MLNNYEIMAIDYYIGNDNVTNQIFFPDSSEIINILSESYHSALYFISKAGDFLKFVNFFSFSTFFLFIFF